MEKVNVIGGTLVDLNFGLPKQFFHRYHQAAKIELPFGEKLTTDGYVLDTGGSGANVALGLRKAGYRVWFHTGIASDVFGEYLRLSLQNSDVDLDEGEYGDQTPLSVILRIGGERTIITGRSVRSSMPTALPATGWLHIGPLHGDLEAGLTKILAHQVKTGQDLSMNPSIDMINDRSRPFLSLIKNTSIIFLNRSEALALTRLPQRSSPKEIITSIIRLGSKIVCLTDGEHGAYVGTSNRSWFAPALTARFERIDATGAGDAFTSGFLASYLADRDSGLDIEPLLEQSLTAAVANSGSTVTAIGGQAGTLTLEEMRIDSRRVRTREVE